MVGGPLTINRTVLKMGRVEVLPPDLVDRVAYVEELAAKIREREHEVIPLDEVLGIDKLPFKMTRGMMMEVAFYGMHERSFEEARGMLYRVHGIRLSVGYIKKISYYVGGMIDAQEEARAKEIAGDMANVVAKATNAEIPKKPDKKGFLQIEMDGSAINTVIRTNGTTWKENKLAVLFSSDHVKMDKQGKREIREKEYVNCFGSVGEFKPRLFEAALRNGYGHYENTVVVSDGAEWIRKLCEDIFPDAVMILDFFHLKENFYTFAKWLFKGDAGKYQPWAEEMAELAYNSRTEELLKRLKRYRNMKNRPLGVRGCCATSTFGIM